MTPPATTYRIRFPFAYACLNFMCTATQDIVPRKCAVRNPVRCKQFGEAEWKEGLQPVAMKPSLCVSSCRQQQRNLIRCVILLLRLIFLGCLAFGRPEALI